MRKVLDRKSRPGAGGARGRPRKAEPASASKTVSGRRRRGGSRGATAEAATLRLVGRSNGEPTTTLQGERLFALQGTLDTARRLDEGALRELTCRAHQLSRRRPQTHAEYIESLSEMLRRFPLAFVKVLHEETEKREWLYPSGRGRR